MGGVRSDTRLAAERPGPVAPKCAVAQIALSSSFPETVETTRLAMLSALGVPLASCPHAGGKRWHSVALLGWRLAFCLGWPWEPTDVAPTSPGLTFELPTTVARWSVSTPGTAAPSSPSSTRPRGSARAKSSLR